MFKNKWLWITIITAILVCGFATVVVAVTDANSECERVQAENGVIQVEDLTPNKCFTVSY